MSFECISCSGDFGLSRMREEAEAEAEDCGAYVAPRRMSMSLDSGGRRSN